MIFLFLPSLCAPLTILKPSDIDRTFNAAGIKLLPNGGALISVEGFLQVLTNDFSTHQGFQPAWAKCPCSQQSDGKILAIHPSSFEGPVTNRAILRFNQDGSIDQTYNSPYVYRTDSINFATVVLQNDGKLLIGLDLNFRDSSRPFEIPGFGEYGVVRLNQDGSLDNTFHFDGIGARGLVVLGDSKILVAGGRDEPRILRLNTNGAVDQSFVGPIFAPSGNDDKLTAIAVQSDGKIIVAGRSLGTVNGADKGSVFRLHGNGSLDNTFHAERSGGALEIKIQSDGKIVLLFLRDIIRLFPNGDLDPTLVAPPVNDNTYYSIDIDSTDRIYLPGSTAIRLSGQLRVKVPQATVPVVLERSFNLANPITWSPIQTIPANTAVEYVDPSYPFSPAFYRVRPAN